MAKNLCKMAQIMIVQDEKHNQEIEELGKELAQVKRCNKEMDKKLDTVKTQTKKKIPVKQLPNRKMTEMALKRRFSLLPS